MAKLRKPANDAERTALAHWRKALPVSAMTALFNAGYSLSERIAFQLSVAGCARDCVADYSDSELAGMWS
jgi:hypothetical protein